jgi:hypothetical protein
MLKTGGQGSAFGEAAHQQASAALASAADDLAVLHAERLERERREQQAPGSGGPVFIKGGKSPATTEAAHDDDDDDDEIDDDPVLKSFREKRLQQLKSDFSQRQVCFSSRNMIVFQTFLGEIKPRTW